MVAALSIAEGATVSSVIILFKLSVFPVVDGELLPPDEVTALILVQIGRAHV